ncbi:hypothetical protein [Lacticaseibacillus jixianensis]|uniref:hypothetical protein n=1 Tax=Lacticaseibacillus jixianensis TaxID=2486012 RepID=UPI000F7A2129|nr:hypothetical protein [Lacticaseibacillus jixianensis]
MIHDFEIGEPLSEVAEPKVGLQTDNNALFLRRWFEVNYYEIKFDAQDGTSAFKSGLKWFPYNKGGSYRKWYGNYDYVINWRNGGQEIIELATKKYKNASRTVKNVRYYFREAITWSLITSGGFSMRFREPGSIHDVSGMSAFSDSHENLLLIMAVMNSKVGNYVLKMLNPTINLQVGNFSSFPVVAVSSDDIGPVLKMTRMSVEIAKDDWNVDEHSWGFNCLQLMDHIAEHPLSHPQKVAHYGPYVPNLRQLFRKI